MRHFRFSSPAEPLGPEDLTWRMVQLQNPKIFFSTFYLSNKLTKINKVSIIFREYETLSKGSNLYFWYGDIPLGNSKWVCDLGRDYWTETSWELSVSLNNSIHLFFAYPFVFLFHQIAGKLVNIKTHIRRSQRVVKESRSVCSCECRVSNATVTHI